MNNITQDANLESILNEYKEDYVTISNQKFAVFMKLQSEKWNLSRFVGDYKLLVEVLNLDFEQFLDQCKIHQEIIFNLEREMLKLDFIVEDLGSDLMRLGVGGEELIDVFNLRDSPVGLIEHKYEISYVS